MASGHGWKSRGLQASISEPSLTQDGLADILSSATVCVELIRNGESDYQYGYLIAPHLVVTVWHPLFAQHVLHAGQVPSEQALPDVWILTSGFPTAADRRPRRAGVLVLEIVAANSLADCVLLRLEQTLRPEHLKLGTFVQPQKGWERAQTYIRQQGSVSSPMGSLRSGTLGRFAMVQSEFGQPQHEFLFEQQLDFNQSYERGAPIISEISGLCLGHLSGSHASMNALWVCPASTISQLNPELLHIWDATPQQKITEQLWRLRLSLPVQLQILTSEPQDERDIVQALKLAGFTSQKPPLFHVDVHQVQSYEQDPLPLDDKADIVLVLLDELLCKYSNFMAQGRLHPLSSFALQPLLACVVADRIDHSAWPWMRACVLQLSVERPLRWIFDRSRRLYAWMQIFNRLQLLLFRAGISQSSPL